MDTDKLKMVVDIIQSISADTKAVVILYFLHNLFHTVLVIAGIMLVASLGARTLSLLWRLNIQLRQWRNQLGIGMAGQFSIAEERETIAKIQELIDAERRQQA